MLSARYFRNIMIFINNIKFNKIKKIFLRPVMRATVCTESNMLSSYSQVVIFNILPEYKFYEKKILSTYRLHADHQYYPTHPCLSIFNFFT
jgi:hypothetical protein